MSPLCVLQLYILLAMPTLPGVAAQASGDFLRKVSTREIVNDLEASLTDILSGHASPAASKRLAAIEASTWQTFQSLPKNEMGRLAPPAVRYLVHGYFAREHGWQVKGLEPHAMKTNVNTSQVHDVNILQDKAPLLVEELLEARHHDHGLALTDIVAMVAVLEQLVFDESVTLLEAAYRLNGVSVTQLVDEEILHVVLKSYLVLFGQGAKADLLDAERHQKLLQTKARTSIEDYERNAVLNFDFARRHLTNPFVARHYSFEVAADIVGDLAQRYGKWQNAECRDMRAHLTELDPDGSGRVPLGLLYAQPQSASYHFSESVDYLRKIGALDESSSVPKVIIPNYITGPSNCIASSSYYAVCCMNNCDSIMNEIEHKVLAPSTSPERLLTLVGNMSNSATLPRALSEKLHTIAARHDGAVPLHSRLFAQWLHFAFPHECPYPAILENAEVLSRRQWHSPSLYVASNEERLKSVAATDAAALASSDFDVDELWSDHEVLFAYGEPQPPLGTVVTGILRVGVQMAVLCLVLRSAVSAWRSAGGAGDGKAKKHDAKKDDDCVLGFRV